ncbi:MAG TPA: transcriptional regulator FtrA [Saliniramus sp.]|nr:transcriptional regulator FtrA [Saliniramus sp.]
MTIHCKREDVLRSHDARQAGARKRSLPESPLVCVLAYDNLCTFEFGIAVEVFGLPRPEFSRWYRCEVVAAEPGPLKAMGGIRIEATYDLALLESADLIIIPGWRGADVPVPQLLVDAIRRAHAAGARVATICSGVFVAAACGLLDGRRATTHWRYVEKLSAMHPTLSVDGDVLYVDEGDVLSSAGSAAGLDLCLHIVRTDFGAQAANSVARRLVLPAHREGGQRQFVPRPVAKDRVGRLAPALDRVRMHLDEPWPISRIAREAGLSERTLMRRMKEVTGQSPQMWLNAERVAHALSLLETTDATLQDIAQACGFNSVETVRHHFRNLKGRPPSWYRSHSARSGEEAEVERNAHASEAAVTPERPARMRALDRV